MEDDVLEDDLPEGEESVDESLARIVSDEPEEESSDEPEAEEAPQASEETDEPSEEDYDDEEMAKAHAAFLRDGLSPKEIALKLQRDGNSKFLSRGLKRAKKHETDDAAYSELKQLKNQTKEPDPGNEGEARNAGPTLSPRDLAAPLAERLGLDEDGINELVAFTEAQSKTKDAEIAALKEQSNHIGAAVMDMLLEGAREGAGLGQASSEDWEKVQQHYDSLVSTDLHGDLSGKARMTALLKSAAKLADVASDLATQRKPALRQAKRKGATMVSNKRTTPPKGASPEELQDDLLAKITSGAFNSDEEARRYANSARSD